MALRARVDAMKASTPSSTRTAPPRMPDYFWRRGNYRGYIAFGSCGFLLFLVSFLLLRVVWALGSGERHWERAVESFGHPLYIAFHVFCLVALVWFALRFFRLFPKTQPPRIGPFRRPPDIVFAVILHSGLLVVSALVLLLFWGILL